VDKPMPPLKDGEQLVYFQSGGEWSFLKTPKKYQSKKGVSPVPVVIWFRGQSSYVRDGETDCLIRPPYKAILNRLLEQGYAVAGSELTGVHYGRASATAASVALYRALVAGANVDAERVGMWTPAGMGGLTMWNSIMGPLHGKVRAVVSTQAVVSYASVIPRRKEAIRRAHGFPEDILDDVLIASVSGYDALSQMGLRLAVGGKAFAKGLPKTLIMHGETDDNIPCGPNAVELHELLKKHGAESTLHVFQDTGHVLHKMEEPIASMTGEFFREAFGR